MLNVFPKKEMRLLTLYLTSILRKKKKKSKENGSTFGVPKLELRFLHTETVISGPVSNNLDSYCSNIR